VVHSAALCAGALHPSTVARGTAFTAGGASFDTTGISPCCMTSPTSGRHNIMYWLAIFIIVILGLHPPSTAAYTPAIRFPTCTPWSHGARPCSNRGVCLATWDNVNARWADDAACHPAGTMIALSGNPNQGPAPTCSNDTDCASGYSCSRQTCLQRQQATAALRFPTCTPWSHGARPCSNRGVCLATWDNVNACWADDAACHPAGTMIALSGNPNQGPAPTCSNDTDCASGYSCSHQAANASTCLPRGPPADMGWPLWRATLVSSANASRPQCPFEGMLKMLSEFLGDVSSPRAAADVAFGHWWDDARLSTFNWAECLRTMQMIARPSHNVTVKSTCGASAACDIVALIHVVDNHPDSFETYNEYQSCAQVGREIDAKNCSDVRANPHG
jgi:hypothetical protein